jgi:hypothetical protein
LSFQQYILRSPFRPFHSTSFVSRGSCDIDQEYV